MTLFDFICKSAWGQKFLIDDCVHDAFNYVNGQVLRGYLLEISKYNILRFGVRDDVVVVVVDVPLDFINEYQSVHSNFAK